MRHTRASPELAEAKAQGWHKIGELQAMQRALGHLARHCHGDQRPDCPILDDLGGAVESSRGGLPSS